MLVNYCDCFFTVGLLEVNNNSVALEEVESELTFVNKGGQWRPDCVSRNKVVKKYARKISCFNELKMAVYGPKSTNQC